MSIPTDIATLLAAASAALRIDPGDERLCDLEELLADERLDRWAEQAPDHPGAQRAKDQLQDLRKLVAIRRRDLLEILHHLPFTEMERLLDPALQDKRAQLGAAADACQSKLHELRGFVTVYETFLQPGHADESLRRLDLLRQLMKFFPFHASSHEEQSEAERRVRAGYAALEKELLTAACKFPAERTDRLLACAA
ncbi:hypothetical protein ACFVGM_09110 [Kitasatospora purpeofusca]|uniref:hypothetical protein n=1 Tax=Kitasatospora purpeofusca TaxID=67352 RepID=UPI0036BBDC52